LEQVIEVDGGVNPNASAVFMLMISWVRHSSISCYGTPMCALPLQVQALVAQGRRALGRSSCVTIGEILRAFFAQPNAPTISETQAMPNPKRIML
jgi:hypothetical protein